MAALILAAFRVAAGNSPYRLWCVLVSPLPQELPIVALAVDCRSNSLRLSLGISDNRFASGTLKSPALTFSISSGAVLLIAFNTSTYVRVGFWRVGRRLAGLTLLITEATILRVFFPLPVSIVAVLGFLFQHGQNIQGNDGPLDA